MTWSKITGLKDCNGTPIHLEDRLVYRYNQEADNGHEAVSIDVSGTVKHLEVKEADLDVFMFLEDGGKSWTIHNEDLPYFTVIQRDSSS